jgi:membrane protein involved in colicin uptake
VDDAAANNAKKKAEQAAARKARAQRIARARKAAARRVAQARAKQEQTAGSFNTAPFGNSFGSFGNSTFGAAAIDPQFRTQSPAQEAR